MLRRQRLGGAAPAREESGPARQSLQAVAVERAGARKGIGGGVAGKAQVTHLGMDEAVHQPAAHESASPDPGADGQVDEGVQPLRRAPAPLAEGGRVHVRVERHRESQRLAKRPCEVDVHPARLGCGGDEAEAARRGSEVDGAERADADPGQGTETCLRVAEERQSLADRLLGAGGGEPRFGAHVVRARCPRRRRTWFPRLRRPRRAAPRSGLIATPTAARAVGPARAPPAPRPGPPVGRAAAWGRRARRRPSRRRSRTPRGSSGRRGRAALTRSPRQRSGPSCRPGYSSWNGVARERRRSTNTRSGSCATPTTTSSPVPFERRRPASLHAPRTTSSSMSADPGRARAARHERRVGLRPQRARARPPETGRGAGPRAGGAGRGPAAPTAARARATVGSSLA